MEGYTLEDAIFEFDLMASDKCNGKNRGKCEAIAEWLKELQAMKGAREDRYGEAHERGRE